VWQLPGSRAVAEGDADARARLGDLGHRVLPRALRAAAGDEQVAAAEEERPAPSARAGTEQEPPRLADRHDGDERIVDLACDAIAVPGHAVVAVAVEVEPHRVEPHPIALREGKAHLLDERQERRLAGLEPPPGGEPG